VRACRAGGLQEEPIRVVQALGLLIDHQAEALRDAELGVAWLDVPHAVITRDHPGRGQCLEEHQEKQRVTVGAPVQPCHQRLWR
jgi:hypothetical protein